MFDFSNIQTAICFFAHPDDETLAAGATISRLCRMGVDFHVLIPSTGVTSRPACLSNTQLDGQLETIRKDCEEALKILGVPSSNIYWGEFSDNEMDKGTLLELIHWFEKIYFKVKPDLVFTHHRYCTNVDHRYCHEAAVVATRPSADTHVAVLCGEIPSSTGYLRPAQWEPNIYFGVDKKDLEKKLAAMETYQSERRDPPHPRSGEVLKALAQVRGSECGRHFAEAFMVQKIIIT